jgi:hypothetical protein
VGSNNNMQIVFMVLKWIKRKRKKHPCHQYFILSDGKNILANFSFVDKIFK